MVLLNTVIFLLIWFVSSFDVNGLTQQPSSPLSQELINLAKECSEADCIKVASNISDIGIQLVNTYASLLMHDLAQDVLKEALYYIPDGDKSGLHLIHMQSMLAFAQGDVLSAKEYWSLLNSTDSLAAKRSLAAQLLMSGNEVIGMSMLSNYTNIIGNKFISILDNGNIPHQPYNQTASKSKSVMSDISEDFFLSFLFSEAQGILYKSRLPLSDLILAVTDLRPIDAALRFRLGVGLAKLGLFDLSLKHVSISATPWENPLYRLRARLSFPPIQASVRSLAQAVDTFEQQGEALLLLSSSSVPTTLMTRICNSLNEAALALQALPLLHLAGYSSPRHEHGLGHSPVALPVLLSEVFQSMCPPGIISEKLDPINGFIPKKKKKVEKVDKDRDKIKIAFMSGSFDGAAGHAIVGLIESLLKTDRENIILTALSFPTPRDDTTDFLMNLFDNHVNLNPMNKSQAISRIEESTQDLLIFTDAGMDSRTFALAHERLATYQALMWGWGGTLGIPTVDYYFIPTALWYNVQCVVLNNNKKSHNELSTKSILPQELFLEQVILLQGLPQLPSYFIKDKVYHDGYNKNKNQFQRDIGLLITRHLLPLANESHIYHIPASVKNLHPEFDAAISIILKTDPKAIVVLAVERSGRDNLPSTHTAVRHDLMHPANPPAAVSKLRMRLQRIIGDDVKRLRILPPLEKTLYRALLYHATALLDPFPVGLHAPLVEALILGTPVVSAPALQECTNSFSQGILKLFGISLDNNGNNNNFDEEDSYYSEWPTTAEEYAVLAMRVQHDSILKKQLTPLPYSQVIKANNLKYQNNNIASQIVKFAKTLVGTRNK